MPKILVTGASGFIGRNLSSQLGSREGWTVLPWGRESGLDELRELIAEADAICHLAGVNRPDDPADFERVNANLTRQLCDLAAQSGRRPPILLASSVHAAREDATGLVKAYGASKRAAEQALLDYAGVTGAPIHIFRLPHVIGKWCRPGYNSVVATFCHNIARDLPIRMDNPDYALQIVYIDDLIETFVSVIEAGEPPADGGPYRQVEPSYAITVGDLAARLRAFRESRQALTVDRVGTGLPRALYATYLSYVPPQDFSYGVPSYGDARGTFVEMLKTPDAGQVSFFTAGPGVTRGGHYHHSKTEKFLVVKGCARFRFRHILSGESHELTVDAAEPRIVDTVPGWAHDITNIGEEDMVVMLWANEVFDRNRPDTYLSAL